MAKKSRFDTNCTCNNRRKRFESKVERFKAEMVMFASLLWLIITLIIASASIIKGYTIHQYYFKVTRQHGYWKYGQEYINFFEKDGYLSDEQCFDYFQQHLKEEYKREFGLASVDSHQCNVVSPVVTMIKELEDQLSKYIHLLLVPTYILLFLSAFYIITIRKPSTSWSITVSFGCLVFDGAIINILKIFYYQF